MLYKLFLVASAILKFSEASKIPDYIHICKRSDPKVSECIVEATNALKPNLKVGIPEINAPAIEPFLLSNISVFSGENSANFKANLYNLKIHGLSNFKIERLRMDVKKLVIRASVSFPVLNIFADYDISGGILFLKLEGNGLFNGNATDVSSKLIMKANIIQNGDHPQMLFTSVDLRAKVGDYHVVLENLFGGDPVLGKATNDVINEAKEDMLAVIIPLLEKEFAKIIIDFGNRITSKFNYDEIFPE